MKIFHLETVKGVGYDSYDSHVVLAQNEEEARKLVPWGDEAWYDDPDGPWNKSNRPVPVEVRKEYESQWWSNPKNATCTEVGIVIGALDKPQVLCSSFNAG